MSARSRRTPGVGGRGFVQSASCGTTQSDRTPGEVDHDWRRLDDDDRVRGLHHVRELREQLHRDDRIVSLGYVIVTNAEMVELVHGRDMATAQAGGR